MVNSGSESDRESNSLTGEGRGSWAWRGKEEEVKESDRASVMRTNRECAMCISSGESVEKTLFLQGLNAAVVNYKGFQVNHL